MKPGMLDEHPMPLIVATSCLGICNSTRAFCTAARTPKSPQPGHQSGSTLPFRSAITIGFGVITSVAILDAPCGLLQNFVGLYFCSNHNFVYRHGKIGLAGELFLDCFHDVMRHEGFTIVLANVTVGDKARFAAQ